MRWSQQTIGAAGQAALPGADGDVAVRSFSAPEALDTRFYEVRAKSALNRVPGGSRVPFKWTVNPYRGCAHACSYCLDGATPILLASGATKPLVDLRRGDAIVGTERRGGSRRYVETTVLDHWSSLKPAYRITLADGTQLVASGDHRFLTRRGWKHVVGSQQGAGRRPHLTVGTRLMGTGQFSPHPEHRRDYRLGYLCGIVRGDGHLGRYEHSRPGRDRDVHHRFRLALADGPALDRAEAFLATEGVATRRFRFSDPSHRRPMDAIRTSAERQVDRLRELIAWPTSATREWQIGFAAGIFDAEGSCGREAMRISNEDEKILTMTQQVLRALGFACVAEPVSANGVGAVRVRGGLVEQLRFFHLTDPAIRRKLRLDGRALKVSGDRRVVSIEPLGGARRLYDITTGTGDFIANGVVSHNCFARPTHEYLELDAGRDFEREIVVKVNVPEVLRAELARPSWKREHVALGTNTDPYQWVEGRYKLMRGIWAAMRDAANPCSVLTKSPLVLRDVDLLREIGGRTDVGACLSVPTLEEDAWRSTEPKTPHPRARLEAVAELNRQGIPTGVLIAPLMPGINDDPRQVEAILALAAEAGATSVGGQALFLRGATRDVFLDWLRTMRPDLVDRYEALFADGSYMERTERLRLDGLLEAGRRGSALAPERFFRRLPRSPEATRAEPAPALPDSQGSLF